ncbi:hypothetical protein [Bifidobacterium platyrrhinorum]|uniref:Uncharacterized protein n=1 Tax=Bifidobacterium platyrrhinorum TaxID=2661628 RepID=A0A6L9SW68_9BIFI|nr:hypothetical protein [Bifidobacterium platyrrhinorum]NEG55441.1 hypothetical protein [Bifidobacterium platyrrhinorum]
MVTRTGADLKGLYESLGFSQADVCHLLGIRNAESLRRQCLGKSPIHPNTWKALDTLARKRDDQVDAILDKFKGCDEVTLPIYAGRKWETSFRNRVVTLAAWVLEGDGVTVHWRMANVE